jgi:hypothetical protein
MTLLELEKIVKIAVIAGFQWFISVIPATWEAEIRRPSV